MSIIGNPILTGGLTPKLIERVINNRGVYNASADGADGYSVVRVTTGGGSDCVGFVHVKFDAGETISAYSGTHRLVSDTTGDYYFQIPSEGTWTFENTQHRSTSATVEYGHSYTVALHNTILPYSIDDDILSYNVASDWNNGSWNNLVIHGTASDVSYDQNDDALHFPTTVYPSYTLPNINKAATAYAVIKTYRNVGGDKGLIGFSYAYTGGCCPGMYSLNNKISYTVYGWDTSTGVDAIESYHVLTVAIESDYNPVTGSVTVKRAHFYIDGSKKAVLNFTTSGDAKLGAYTDSAGRNDILVKFFAVVDGCETDETIINNHQIIMDRYGIAA